MTQQDPQYTPMTKSVIDWSFEDFENQTLSRVSDGLAEAINEHVGVKLVTRSVLVDSVQVGILGKDGIRRVLPTLKVGKALWSSVECYLAFARECARADELAVSQR